MNNLNTVVMTFFSILIAIAFAILPERAAAASDFELEDCGTATLAPNAAPGLGRAVAFAAEDLTFPLPPAPCLDCGEAVAYTAFDGTPYTLTRYQGAFVDLLLPDSWIQGNVLSTEQRRLLIDRADYFYAHSAELISREPAGVGKLTMAVIDSTCGLGCGYIGSKGIEVLSTQAGIDHVVPALEAGVLPGAFEHELMHNFDVFSSYLFSGNGTPDGHAWTSFVQYYMTLYARTGSRTDTPEDTMARWLEEILDPYMADPTATWASCVSTGTCPNPTGISPNNAWAGISNQFSVLHGPEVVRSFFTELDAHAASNPPATTLQGKADLHLDLMARAANEDLRCYVDHWKWSISQALDTEMATLPAASFCADGDLDGFSRLEGDCDDDDGQAYPGATEVLNGIDDNCSGNIDDLAYVEPVGGDFAPNQLVNLPGTIEGEIVASDEDDFTFDLPAPMNVEIEMCSTGFQGFLFVLNEDNSWFDYQYVFENGCHKEVYALDEARVWRFVVALNAASLPGDYQVRIRPAPEWPLASAWGAPDPVTEPFFPVTLGTQSIANDPAYPPTDARFWVSGIGFTDSVPYSNSATTSFSPWPYGDGEYSYRVQLLSSGVPATDWSSEVTFVPEPGMGGMLAVGVIGLLSGRRRRFRASRSRLGTGLFVELRDSRLALSSPSACRSAESHPAANPKIPPVSTM